MTNIVKDVADRFDIRKPAIDIKDKLVHQARVLARRISFTDNTLVRDYLLKAAAPKLHLGAGKHPINGWLNTDYNPLPGITFLDATRPFPFASGLFTFVYSEHMIEHVPYEAGLAMLRECFRVLKPGGVIRLSTPDLAFLVNLYRGPEDENNAQYIRHSTDTYIRAAPGYLPGFVINNFVRDWGHQFIYDQKTLRLSFAMAGFKDVRHCSVGESANEELNDLENTSRMPLGFLSLESLILEGTKPLGDGAAM